MTQAAWTKKFNIDLQRLSKGLDAIDKKDEFAKITDSLKGVVYGNARTVTEQILDDLTLYSNSDVRESVQSLAGFLAGSHESLQNIVCSSPHDIDNLRESMVTLIGNYEE